MKIDDVKGLREFLDEEKVAVVSVPIDNVGSIHSAALLYAHVQNPLEFYFITSTDTEKFGRLIEQDVNGSAVVGLHKGVGFTLQMRGNISYKELKDSKEELDVFEAKTGKRIDSLPTDNDVLLIFKPSWARVTDYASEEAADGLEKHQLEV